MNYPEVIATVTESGIEIQFKNWTGVTNMMIEHIHYAIVKQSQIHRAKMLGALHKVRMDSEALERKTNAAPDVLDFNKELANVLK